jgi:glycosyltransferase involved in cell wall biosynthesis
MSRDSAMVRSLMDADGDPDSAGADYVEVVTRLYYEILNREPDYDGLRHYCDAISSGQFTPDDVKRILSSSEEYLSRGLLQTYDDTLHRPPETGELHCQLQRLKATNVGMESIRKELEQSVEGMRNRQRLQEAGKAYRNRTGMPAPTCLNRHLADLLECSDDSLDVLLNRIELARKTTREKLERYYDRLLGRAPVDEEVDAWLYFPGTDEELFTRIAWTAEASAIALNQATALAESVRRRRTPGTVAFVFTHPLMLGGAERLLSYWDRCADPHIAHILIQKHSAYSTDDFEFPNFLRIGYTNNQNLNSILKILDPDVVVDHTTLLHPEAFAVIYNGLEDRVSFFAHSAEVFERSPSYYRTRFGLPVRSLISNFAPQGYDPEWREQNMLVAQLSIYLDEFPAHRRYYRMPLRVGIVGRLAADKMSRSFIGVLRQFDDPDFEFHIYGSGDQYGSEILFVLRESSNVKYHGAVAPHEMAGVYRQLDILLCPSPTETGGYALLEAMAAGIPVVARNTGPQKEIVGDGGIVRGNEDAALFSSLQELKNLDLLRRLSANARRKVVGDNGDVGRQFRQYYEFLAAHSRLRLESRREVGAG